VRAVRSALAVVRGVEIEILKGVEAVGPTGDVVVATLVADCGSHAY
jgi:hypothetical protein